MAGPRIVASVSKAVGRKDVAALAGVAPVTVSLVLNGNPGIRVPATTRTRIFEAAASLGYRPSNVARSLASGRTHSVGVAIHFLATPFHTYTARVLNGAWRVVREHQCRLVLDEGTAEREAANLFHEKCVDGLLVLAPPAQPLAAGEFAAIAQARFPMVLIGAALPEMPLDYVDVDNAGAARLAVEALLAAGHRRIAHITGSIADSSAARDRLKGYRLALRAAGVAFDQRLVVAGNWGEASGRSAAVELLRRGLAFTAIFGANDGMACGAVQVLLEQGRNVPRDVSVVGIDGFRGEAPEGIDLATVRQPVEEIGRTAAELLFRRIGGYVGRQQQRLLTGSFYSGNTVVPPQPR